LLSSSSTICAAAIAVGVLRHSLAWWPLFLHLRQVMFFFLELACEKLVETGTPSFLAGNSGRDSGSS
jgi:hypothetical protein